MIEIPPPMAGKRVGLRSCFQQWTRYEVFFPGNWAVVKMWRVGKFGFSMLTGRMGLNWDLINLNEIVINNLQHPIILRDLIGT